MLLLIGAMLVFSPFMYVYNFKFDSGTLSDQYSFEELFTGSTVRSNCHSSFLILVMSHLGFENMIRF